MWEACGLGGGMGRGGDRGVGEVGLRIGSWMRVLVFNLIAVEVRDARSSWKHLRGFVRFLGRKRPLIIEVCTMLECTFEQLLASRITVCFSSVFHCKSSRLCYIYKFTFRCVRCRGELEVSRSNRTFTVHNRSNCFAFNAKV
jgi:hypothetical protein